MANDNRITLTIKLSPGKDDALIDWWQGLPKGDYQSTDNTRQSLAKQALRRALNLPEAPTLAVTSDSDEVEALRDHIKQLESWIERIANDLPGYVQTEIRKSLVNGAPLPPPQVEGGARLEDSALEKREKRMKSSNW